MASFFIFSKCAPVRMSRHPVVVTKIWPSETASSMVVTSNPETAACKAFIGSTSGSYQPIEPMGKECTVQNTSNQDSGSHTPQRIRATFTNIAVSSNNSNL